MKILLFIFDFIYLNGLSYYKYYNLLNVKSILLVVYYSSILNKTIYYNISLSLRFDLLILVKFSMIY